MALVNKQPIEEDVQYDRGVVKIKRVPITRDVIETALEKAVLAYKKDHPDEFGDGKDGGFYPSVMKRTIIETCLLGWDEAVSPPALGWMLLPPDSDEGDKIEEAMGLPLVMEYLERRGREVERAKNSSSGAGA